MEADRRRVPLDSLRAGAWESWELEVIDPSARLGVRVGLALGERAAWWTVVCGSGRRVVAVIDDDVPLPGWPNLEVRASGLWAEIGVQDPGVHLTADLEAFGVEVDAPSELFGAARGVRQPVGLDLEWHALHEPSPAECGADADGLVVVARAEGTVLVGRDEIDVDSTSSGSWTHRWGLGSWPGPAPSPSPSGATGVEPEVPVAEAAVAVAGWRWRRPLLLVEGDGWRWGLEVVSSPGTRRDG